MGIENKSNTILTLEEVLRRLGFKDLTELKRRGHSIGEVNYDEKTGTWTIAVQSYVYPHNVVSGTTNNYRLARQAGWEGREEE